MLHFDHVIPTINIQTEAFYLKLEGDRYWITGPQSVDTLTLPFLFSSSHLLLFGESVTIDSVSPCPVVALPPKFNIASSFRFASSQVFHFPFYLLYSIPSFFPWLSQHNYHFLNQISPYFFPIIQSSDCVTIIVPTISICFCIISIQKRNWAILSAQ